jgi:site-specific DNA-methyltransferase (adenine-specific)
MRYIANYARILLWFVKGKRPRPHPGVCDVIPSKIPDRLDHPWQQSGIEAEYLIERLTVPGELVVDPMAGSGTTLVAAKKLGRRFLGCEIERDRAKIATANLQ